MKSYSKAELLNNVINIDIKLYLLYAHDIISIKYIK